MESTKVKSEMNLIHPHHNCTLDRILWGLAIISAGVMLLLTGNGTIDMAWRDIFFSWHMLVFIFGIQALLHKHYLFGMILIAVSVLVEPSFYVRVFEMNALDAESLIFIQRQAFYVAIIIFGIWIILRGFFKKNFFCCDNHHRCYTDKDGNREFSAKFGEMNMDSNKNGRIDYQFAFSGSEQIFLEPVFRGGRIKTVFGGLTLDLRKAALEEGNTVLDIDTAFGGVELVLPEDWNVDIRSQCFCGGFDDKRVTKSIQDRSKCLIINVKCFFGGGDIK